MDKFNSFFKTKSNLVLIGVVVLVTLAAGIFYIQSTNQSQVAILEDLPTEGVIEDFPTEGVPLSEVALVNASELGLVANDETFAKANIKLLVDAINEGKNVVIDSYYYIGYSSAKVTQSNIVLKGTEGGALAYNGGQNYTLIDTKSISSLDIQGITFENASEHNFLIAYTASLISNSIDRVSITDCQFKGDISAFRYAGDYNVDPSTYSIGQFEFSNNLVQNTRMSFIVLSDVSVISSVIENNQIENFDLIFYANKITNGKQYSKLLNDVGDLQVRNNVVTNDKEWWSTKGVENSYLCFILFEGDLVSYEGNHVEGIKSTVKSALYDVYLSANTVQYTGNVWKNNINFASDKEYKHNALIKSKQGGSGPFIREYKNNQFIIEESFATQYNMPLDYLAVDFLDLLIKVDRFEISNNLIDVYSINFTPTSLNIDDYIFVGNTISAQQATGVVVNLRIADNIAKSVDVADNDIQVERQDKNLDLSFMKVVNTKSKSLKIDEFSFKNNEISGPFGYIFYGVNASNVDASEYKTNTIKVYMDNFKGMSYGSSTNLRGYSKESLVELVK